MLSTEPASGPQRGETLSDIEEGFAPQRGLEEIIEEILAQHHMTGGATFSFYEGDLSGRPLYAVAVHPDRSHLVIGEALAARHLRAFVGRNKDLLSDPRNALGTWYSEAAGVTALDISITVSSLQEAAALGRLHAQDAVFDLKHMTEIRI